MMFIERIKQLMGERQLPLRKLAEALDVDSASYCIIECEECRARKEYLSILIYLLQANREEFLTLGLADQVTTVVEDEQKADKALSIAKENLK